MLALRRVVVSTVGRRPGVVGIRTYATGRTEGSVAESKGFNKKEKAHEDQFVHQHEREQFRKLREQIERNEAELAKLKEQEAHLSQNATKKQ